MINIFKQTELYLFEDGVNSFRYSSGMRDVEVNGLIYKRETIKRTSIKRDQTLSKNKLDITMPTSNQLVQSWITPDITKYLIVSVYVLNNENMVMNWSGRLTQTSISEKEMTMTFELLITRSGQTGVNERVQRNCRYVLYSDKCGLNRDDFAVKGTVTSYHNDVLFIEFEKEVESGYFTAGILQTPNGEQTLIKEHNENNIVLFRPNQQLIQNLKNNITSVTLFKGCQRTISSCDTFNNTVNYGGFPWLPLEPLNSGHSIV
jgi:hypothetical protein